MIGARAHSTLSRAGVTWRAQAMSAAPEGRRASVAFRPLPSPMTGRGAVRLTRATPGLTAAGRAVAYNNFGTVAALINKVKRR